MAFITEYEDKKEVFEIIKNRLSRIGLRISYRKGWEVHGPHPYMNYQVFVSFVTYKNGTVGRQTNKRPFGVAVYPKRVYAIEFDEWSNSRPEDSIPVLKTIERR